MAKNLHVVPRSTGWAVKTAGASRAATIVPTQAQAIQVARQMASSRGSEMLIHGRNGQIREKNSSGSDPEASKG
jgi:hypothetical protein